MISDRLYEQARKRVKTKRKFYSHVLTWVMMSVFFILLNIFTSDYFWAIFPILGWGIGVAFHGIQVYSGEWEDREVEKEYERIRERNINRYGDELDDIVARSQEHVKWKDKDLV